MTNDFSQVFQTKNSLARVLNYILLSTISISVKFKLLCVNNFNVTTDLSSSKKSIGEINNKRFLHVKYATFFYKITQNFRLKKAKWKFSLNKFLISLIRWPEFSVISGSFKNICLSTAMNFLFFCKRLASYFRCLHQSITLEFPSLIFHIIFSLLSYFRLS